MPNSPLVDESSLVDEPLSPTIVSTELDFEGRVWDVRRDVFEYNGHELTRDYVDHPGAVAVLVLDDDGRVLLIQQYRHPIRSRDWEIPAGLLDVEHEDPLAAAKRELAEEVDLVASEWSPLVTFNSSPGGSNELIRVFLARGISATSSNYDRTEEEADIVIRWVPVDEVISGVLAGDLRNSILAIAVLAAHARG
ncbi:MAG: 8-oxo-dGDP phosphatase [Actinomycetota bacterium]|jgi:ADP-ribose pyrophosphatase|nr:8-oxo-dGDP phosphatase [Actinomycetota bacterium]